MFARRYRVATLIVAGLVLGACSDQAPEPIRSSQPSFTQVDGATSGNPHFYFLRPTAPSNPSFTGVFNPDLYPTVEVCTGTTLTSNGHCATLFASFRTDGGYNNNGEVISIPNGEQMYKLEWHTGSYVIPVDQSIRISVLLGNFLAGYIDVVKGSDGKFRDTETNTVISGNSTLPIKFRIEKGVICGTKPHCIENAVTPGGEDVIENGFAGAEFPGGAVEQTVNLVIEGESLDKCLPTDLPQFKGCVHFSTEPEVENFQQVVEVAICIEPAGVPYMQAHQLRLWKWSEVPGEAMKELEPTTVNLECPTATASLESASPLVRGLARAGNMLMTPIAALFGPTDAYAIGGYEGGKLINFSRVGWVRPLDIEITQGNNQTGTIGGTLPINPTVRLKNRYGTALTGPDPFVLNWPVTFTPSPNGVATPASTTANAGGFASTAWTLSTTIGANTLLAKAITSQAIAPAPYETQVTFNATGEDLLKVKWLTPLVAKSTVTGIYQAGRSPIITVSVVGGPVLATLPMTESNSQYSVNWNIPTLDATKQYKVAVSGNGVEYGYVLLEIVNNELRNVTTGDKVLNLKNSRTLPIKLMLFK